MKLAEALLLRKQLEAKVRQLEPLKLNGEQGVYKDEVQRVKVTEDIEQITMRVARIDIKTVTRDYDRYASELRRLDAAIQQANWSYDVNFDGSSIDAQAPAVTEEKPKRTRKPKVATT